MIDDLKSDCIAVIGSAICNHSSSRYICCTVSGPMTYCVVLVLPQLLRTTSKAAVMRCCMELCIVHACKPS